MAETGRPSTKGDLGRRLAHKALMPIVATAASAAAGYAAKKGPDLFEDKVLPNLKQAAGGAGAVAENSARQGKSVAGDAGELTSGWTGGLKEAAAGGRGGGGGGTQRRKRALSEADRD